MIPTLTELCLKAVITIFEAEQYNHKLIYDICKHIPDHLLEPIFDVLQQKGVVNDVTLMLFLLPSRTQLSLPHKNNIKNSTLKQIGYNCPYLYRLDLSDCVQVSNSVVRTVLQGCPILSDLKLNRCHRVTDAAFDMTQSPFQTLVGCLSLEAISLQGCPQITGEIVTTLNKICGNLKYLNLSQCKQIASTVIKHVFEHHHLLNLNLSFIGSVSDEAFLSMPKTVSNLCIHSPRSPLRKLNLGQSEITDLSMYRMAYLSSLVEIRLQWCHGITDEGIEALTTNCPYLRLIDLKSCLITNKSVISIAKSSKDLVSLDLSWCSQITDESIEYLGSSNLAKLEQLILVWCSGITEQGYNSLEYLPSLKKLEVSGCVVPNKDCLDNLQLLGVEVIL